MYLPATPVFGSRCLANIAHAQSILQAEVQDRFVKKTETKQKQKQKKHEQTNKHRERGPTSSLLFFFFLAVNEDPIIIDYATHKDNYIIFFLSSESLQRHYGYAQVTSYRK